MSLLIQITSDTPDSNGIVYARYRETSGATVNANIAIEINKSKRSPIKVSAKLDWQTIPVATLISALGKVTHVKVEIMKSGNSVPEDSDGKFYNNYSEQP